MKTNISGVMLMISDYKEKAINLEKIIKSHIYNISIQELSGKMTIIEDYKKDFKTELKDYQVCLDRITKLKGILYSKNSEFTLSDGSTIQEAIVKNENNRKLKTLYEYLIGFRSDKSRITEVNNSYFSCRDINYDIDDMKKEIIKLEKEIQNIDFEISKLNSIEFDITL